MIPLPLSASASASGKNKNLFEIQGLYPGYGVTVGNALRRVLLSSIEGAAITELKIQGVPHEFSTIKGVQEDVIMLMLNVKNLRFKIHEGQSHKIELSVKGEKEVTGADFELPAQVSLANPELHIATITDKGTELKIEITVEKGIGYEPRDQRKIGKPEIGSIVLDAIFTPIKNVNFRVESMRVGERTDFDKLSIELETDGTITPQAAFYEACDILNKHFSFLLENKKDQVEAMGKEEKTAASDDSGKMNVEDLNVSARVITALQDNHIKTMAGLIKKSENDLSELEGLGDKGIAEIKKALKKLGLALKSEE